MPVVESGGVNVVVAESADKVLQILLSSCGGSIDVMALKYDIMVEYLRNVIKQIRYYNEYSVWSSASGQSRFISQ